MPLQRVRLLLQRAGGVSDSEYQTLTAKTRRLVTLEVREQEPSKTNNVKTESAQIWHCWCSETDISHSLLKISRTLHPQAFVHPAPDAIELQSLQILCHQFSSSAKTEALCTIPCFCAVPNQNSSCLYLSLSLHFFLCYILLYQVTFTSSLLSLEMGSDPQEAKLPTCALYTLSVSRLLQNAADRATVPVTLLIYRTLYHLQWHYTTKEHIIEISRC